MLIEIIAQDLGWLPTLVPRNVFFPELVPLATPGNDSNDRKCAVIGTAAYIFANAYEARSVLNPS